MGVAYQASPQIHAFLYTELANLSISNSSTIIFGADYVPVTVGAFFSPSNALDVGASIGWFDLVDASTSSTSRSSVASTGGRGPTAVGHRRRIGSPRSGGLGPALRSAWAA
ncbi:MAG: hypothetical protein HS111_34910 [Kofleriaceae bacterium]|nr:hypothetical protein [Kofleriaceae bacterium]